MNIKYLNVENLFYLSLLTLPLFFLTGPFLTDLFICLIGIMFIVTALKKNILRDYIYNRFTFIFLIFYVIILLSSLWSDFIFLSLESSLFYFRFLFFSLGTFYILSKFKNSLYYFSIFFLCIYIFIIFDGFIQYYIGFDLFGFEKPSLNRLSGPFNDELILGGVVSRFYPLATLCIIYLNSKIKFNFLLLFILFTLAVLSIVLHSGERTALFLLLMSIIIMIFTIKKISFKSSLILLFSICLILFIMFFLNSDIRKRIIDTTYNQIYPYDREANSGIICANTPEKCKRSLIMFSVNHHGHYLTGIKMFFDKPIIGHGPKTFREKCEFDKFKTYSGCSTHPHNMYIQLASETGIFGLIIPICLFIFVTFNLFKLFIFKFLNRELFLSDFKICLLISFFITLFPLAPSGNIFNNYVSFIYYLPLGFFLYFNFIENNENKS